MLNDAQKGFRKGNCLNSLKSLSKLLQFFEFFELYDILNFGSESSCCAMHHSILCKNKLSHETSFSCWKRENKMIPGIIILSRESFCPFSSKT